MIFPISPRLLRGGNVLIDPETSAVQRIITLQYNPDTLSRTLQVQGVGTEEGGRSEALRLKGPPIETLKHEAEIDATDQLEFPKYQDAIVRKGFLQRLVVHNRIEKKFASNGRPYTASQAGRFCIYSVGTGFVFSNTYHDKLYRVSYERNQCG